MDIQLAIEECLKSRHWAERTSALIVLNKAKDMLGYTCKNDYTDTEVLRKEYELLIKLKEHARHSNYCNHEINSLNDCNCGFSKDWEAWVNR